MKRVLNLFIGFAVFALLAVNVHAEIGDNIAVDGLRVAEDDEVIVESSITVYGTIGTAVYSSIDAQLLAIGVSTGALDTAKLDKSSATATYLQLNGKAEDSELLDGLDSTGFQLNLDTETWTAYDSDNLGGVAAANYLTDVYVEALEDRCDDLDTSTETLTDNLSALETRVDNLDASTETLTDAVSANEVRLDGLDSSTDSLTSSINDINADIDLLAAATGQLRTAIDDEVLDRIGGDDALDASTATLTIATTALGVATGTIAETLAQVQVDTGTLDSNKLDASSATASYVHIRGDDAIDGDKDFSGDVTIATANIFVANIGTTLEMNPFLGGAVQEGKIDWGSVERRVSWSDTYGAINTSTNVRVAGNATITGIISGMSNLKIPSINKATAQSTTPTADELGCIYYLTDGSNQVYCIISTGTVAGGFATVGDGSIDWN